MVSGSGLCFELVRCWCIGFTLGVILIYTIIYYIIYYILYYYTYIIISYPILYSSLLLIYLPFYSPSVLLPVLLSFPFSSYSPLPSHIPFPPLPLPNPLIQSIRVGIWVYLLILFQLYRCFDPACFIGVDG